MGQFDRKTAWSESTIIDPLSKDGAIDNLYTIELVVDFKKTTVVSLPGATPFPPV